MTTRDKMKTIIKIAMGDMAAVECTPLEYIEALDMGKDMFTKSILDMRDEVEASGEEEEIENIAPTDPFDNANWYSVGDDCDELNHKDWSEALGEHFDNTGEPGVHIKQQCKDLAPIEMVAWKKKELGRSWAEDMVDRFIDELTTADCMAESWWENYGDVDGDYPPIQCTTNDEKAAVKVLNKKLTDVLYEYMKEHSHIWQCDVSGKKEFSLEDLEEFAKLNYEKEWNEPE